MQTGPEAEHVLPVLASADRVASRAALVRLHPEKIDSAVSKWGHMLSPAPLWDHPCHLCTAALETARWIFTLDVLNHCFWPDAGEPVWTVRYRGSDRSGYWGLAASLKRAWEQGVPVTDPEWLAGVTEHELARVFSGKGRIPLFPERLMNLREAGSVILSDLDGDIVTLIEKASGSAVRLVREVVSHFPSFRDEAMYQGGRVFFWKRAQIFAADLFAAFNGKGAGGFGDISRLTAFADYKLPQVLRELGILTYRRDLADRIDSLTYLDPGSEPEIEIRSMTIVAVEEIRKALDRAGTGATSAEVDGRLWQLGQKDEFRGRPYHRCRTIYY